MRVALTATLIAAAGVAILAVALFGWYAAHSGVDYCMVSGVEQRRPLTGTVTSRFSGAGLTCLYNAGGKTVEGETLWIWTFYGRILDMEGRPNR